MRAAPRPRRGGRDPSLLPQRGRREVGRSPRCAHGRFREGATKTARLRAVRHGRAPHRGADRAECPLAVEPPRLARGEIALFAQRNSDRGPRQPRPALVAGMAAGGARMDRAHCAREHTHQGAGRSPRRAAYLRWFCGAPVRRRTRRAARGARCPAPGVPTPERTIGRRHAPRTAARSSTRARVHPREDAPNRNRAVAQATARVAATDKAQTDAPASGCADTPRATRRPTDGGRPDRGAPSARRP